MIANHPMPGNRYGYPGHIERYATPFADFEVNFLPDYKNLHEAGYNVPAYDLRNHGRSGCSQRRHGRVQPVSLRALAETALAQVPRGIDHLEMELKNITGFNLDELSPIPYAPDVTAPTLIAQVRHDSATRPEDVESIHAALVTPDKRLHWIEGTTRRFDDYHYFGTIPKPLIDWITSHLPAHPSKEPA